MGEKGNRLVMLSKFLSLLLRHKPDILDIKMSKDGYVDMGELLEKIRKVKKFGWVRYEDILEIVKRDKKNRFEIKELGDRKYIRAKYGHNKKLDVNIDYPKINENEVEVLYHGTNSKVLPWILREGLKPMNRKYVHLLPTPEDALLVSKRRRGKPVILKINVKKFVLDGGEVWKATNKVYLAKEIPPRYIRIHKYGE
ncbi:MAG: RNA 2'-phosphotransferase [Candidatus Njordarchaeia archaeon]